MNSVPTVAKRNALIANTVRNFESDEIGLNNEDAEEQRAIIN